MLKQTLFPGLHNMKQLDKILEVMGFPADEDLAFVNNEHSLNYLRRLPKKPVVKWEEKLPGANPLALDLLGKMLCFSPEHRITVQEAISHPYFKNFQHLGSPPVSETKFDWTWDQFELNKDLLQRLVYMESLFFHPEEDKNVTPQSAEAGTAPTTKGEGDCNLKKEEGGSSNKETGLKRREREEDGEEVVGDKVEKRAKIEGGEKEE